MTEGPGKTRTARRRARRHELKRGSRNRKGTSGSQLAKFPGSADHPGSCRMLTLGETGEKVHRKEL